ESVVLLRDGSGGRAGGTGEVSQRGGGGSRRAFAGRSAACSARYRRKTGAGAKGAFCAAHHRSGPAAVRRSGTRRSHRGFGSDGSAPAHAGTRFRVETAGGDWAAGG